MILEVDDDEDLGFTAKNSESNQSSGRGQPIPLLKKLNTANIDKPQNSIKESLMEMRQDYEDEDIDEDSSYEHLRVGDSPKSVNESQAGSVDSYYRMFESNMLRFHGRKNLNSIQERTKANEESD